MPPFDATSFILGLFTGIMFCLGLTLYITRGIR